MIEKHKKRDYFAEMYVAGVMADAGWNIYFPHRDMGFDLIGTLARSDGLLIRPVQVKGLYPTEEKTAKNVYGYVGGLSVTHPEMVLALAYFPTIHSRSPNHIAWMPLQQIRPHIRGFRCQPAKYDGNNPVPRQNFEHYFDDAGLMNVAANNFSELT
ncbi:hypothetical protein F7D01_11055 [Erythrobacter sp. 3-20A1M]|uniref:hypothetical protein n=1 Tax=Erythrobacter sp. 3-20A1M TaxID=2653850 RepID=UPI001BFC865C|nr:hypothetical protein [Erythrobacter sp. 3-20A1M]QWC57545.1 hypothetical protein F7D01_11055 [Erythrobacter sp. 3-20A1M]